MAVVRSPNNRIHFNPQMFLQTLLFAMDRLWCIPTVSLHLLIFCAHLLSPKYSLEEDLKKEVRNI